MTDKVLSIEDWYDGPRAGVAEYQGRPYLYRSVSFHGSPEFLHLDVKSYYIEDDIFILHSIEINEDFRLAVWNNFIYYNLILEEADRQQIKVSGKEPDWVETYETQTRLVYDHFTFSPHEALLCRARFEHLNPAETCVIWTPWQPPA